MPIAVRQFVTSPARAGRTAIHELIKPTPTIPIEALFTTTLLGVPRGDRLRCLINELSSRFEHVGDRNRFAQTTAAVCEI